MEFYTNLITKNGLKDSIPSVTTILTILTSIPCWMEVKTTCAIMRCCFDSKAFLEQFESRPRGRVTACIVLNRWFSCHVIFTFPTTTLAMVMLSRPSCPNPKWPSSSDSKFGAKNSRQWWQLWKVPSLSFSARFWKAQNGKKMGTLLRGTRERHDRRRDLRTVSIFVGFTLHKRGTRGVLSEKGCIKATEQTRGPTERRRSGNLPVHLTISSMTKAKWSDNE